MSSRTSHRHPQFLLLLLGASIALTSPALGGTWYVAVNGVDGPDCITKDAPCRSISRAIANAGPGDKIIVGPGRYGDLDGDGTIGEPGEETPSPGCGCMLSFNKAVSLTSSDGAAATVIDARSVNASTNVVLITDGGEFGRPGKGFTVTNTFSSTGFGIAIDSNNLAVRGNVLLGGPTGTPGTPTIRGIVNIDNTGIVLIEGNYVVGWSSSGIAVDGGTGKTVRKNHVSANGIGILVGGDTIVTGNVATANAVGIRLFGSPTATKNAVRGNRFFGFDVGSFSGTIEGNDLLSNDCGLHNVNTAGLQVPNNFWGSATGPGPAPANPICNDPGATTNELPVATKAFNVKTRVKP